jgi:hypothetical protein
MSLDEIASFLSAAPAGALCVAVDELVAVPAAVVAMHDDDVELVATHPLVFEPGAAGCFVADAFPSYDAIRGVIVQGELSGTANRVRLAIQRSTGFAFGPQSPSL